MYVTSQKGYKKLINENKQKFTRVLFYIYYMKWLLLINVITLQKKDAIILYASFIVGTILLSVFSIHLIYYLYFKKDPTNEVLRRSKQSARLLRPLSISFIVINLIYEFR